MTIETDIHSTPEVLKQTIAAVEANRFAGELLAGQVLFLGSGSSNCVGLASSRLYEDRRGAPAQALLPSEYRPRPDWMHVAISRTGQTTELITAMRVAKSVGARVLLIVGEADSPAEAWADATLALPFAAEQGVVQTRFITAAVLALRILITGDNHLWLPEAIEEALTREPIRFDQPHAVYLGRGWRQGLASSAALTLQEAALEVAESHQTLDYRHGPIACADAATFVWCFDPPGDDGADAVLRDVEATGAAMYQSAADPLVSLVQAQLFAAQRAIRRGVDAEAPRHLTRAVVLPNG